MAKLLLALMIAVAAADDCADSDTWHVPGVPDDGLAPPGGRRPVDVSPPPRDPADAGLRDRRAIGRSYLDGRRAQVLEEGQQKMLVGREEARKALQGQDEERRRRRRLRGLSRGLRRLRARVRRGLGRLVLQEGEEGLRLGGQEHQAVQEDGQGQLRQGQGPRVGRVPGGVRDDDVVRRGRRPRVRDLRAR